MQGDGPVVIMGDFNISDVNWPANLEFSSKLCDLLFHYNFTQIIESPTYVQGHILDLIIINIDDNITTPIIHSEDN